MVESDDVVKDIVDRYNRINTLESIKQEANLIWSDLDKTMSKAFEDFSKKVVSI